MLRIEQPEVAGVGTYSMASGVHDGAGLSACRLKNTDGGGVGAVASGGPVRIVSG
jgi:hypothetical protein